MKKGNPRIRRFDLSCFNGEYVTGDVTPEYLAELERARSDEAKAIGARHASKEAFELLGGR